MATATMTLQNGQVSNQQRFFRFFQDEATALQKHMLVLEDHGISGGERSDAIDYCLAGIAKLSNEVKDASSYLPPYDQRTYGEALKALTEKLQKTRSSLAPRQKFSFKSGFPKKNASAISLADAAEISAKQRLAAPGYNSSADSSFANTPSGLRTPASERADGVGELPSKNSATASIGYDGSNIDTSGQQPTTAIRKPSFSQAKSISISNHNDVHIILPMSASHATSSGTLSSIRRAVIDMSMSTASGRPFAALYLKNIKDSLIVCGHVNGAIHITGVSNSVIVVAARQFRMHESSECDVYLHCASRPIIEDCRDIRFAPLPDTYTADADKETPNQYTQVDDFKWLKVEASPNWSILAPESRVDDEVWRTVVPGQAGVGPADILKAAHVVV